ncbi:MAG: amidohydrolase family protein [Myxococcota bacterium]|nr:amidohydrolase family protein [Myxococcota bacterium]
MGKSADLVVIDRNVFEIEPQEISETKVLLTLLEGEAVHGELPEAP